MKEGGEMETHLIKATGKSISSLCQMCAVTFLTACGGMADATAATDKSHGDVITIYSTAVPGAISPDMYRPVAGRGQYQSQAIPGYAIVRHVRPVTLSRGVKQIRFTNVAALIDPTTVQFSSLTDPNNTRVIEQNFQFDLVGTNKLMQRYIDRDITIERIIGDKLTTFTGTLLSATDGLILRDQDDQIHAVRGYANIRFPELPGGLITRPTLVWDVSARRAGEHTTRVAYETKGMTWWADYNLVYADGKNANDGYVDVGAWVSIINQSGAGYEDARLKLIAGDVYRAQIPGYASAAMRTNGRRELMAMEEDAGFDEKSFFEFHLYTLGRRTTLPNNSTKQIELFPTATRVPAEKILVYYGLPQSYYPYYGHPVTDRNFGTQTNKKVDTYLRFKNEKKNGLGIPLPSGRIRVAKLDNADGSLEFIGEDTIDHTPKDETVLIKLGSAFDVVGERKQIDFKVDTSQKWLEEEIEITLRNHKEEAVEVIVKENLYRWVNWDIISRTHSYEKQDSRTIHFPVTVPKDGEKKITYRVRYTW